MEALRCKASSASLAFGGVVVVVVVLLLLLDPTFLKSAHNFTSTQPILLYQDILDSVRHSNQGLASHESFESLSHDDSKNIPVGFCYNYLSDPFKESSSND